MIAIKILIIINFILTSQLTSNSSEIIYGSLDNINILNDFKVDVCFSNIEANKFYNCIIIKYETKLQCNLCKKDSEVLFRRKGDNDQFICSCTDCCNNTKAFNTFFIKLNSKCNSPLFNFYVTGEIDDIFKLENLIFELSFKNVNDIYYQSENSIDLKRIKRELFILKIAEIKDEKKLFTYSEKYLKVANRYNINSNHDDSVTSICYRFSNSRKFKTNIKICHYLTIKGFQISYNKELLLLFCLIFKSLSENKRIWVHNNKNKIKVNSPGNLLLRFDDYYNVDNDKLVKYMAEFILKTYLVIYTNDSKIKYPNFDPFAGFTEYEILVTLEDMYKKFVSWLLDKGKSYSVVYSRDFSFVSQGLFEKLKSLLYSENMLEIIKENCRKLELFNFFLSIKHQTILFVLYFERIILREEQKIIYFHILKYFKRKKINYKFQVINVNQMYGAFKVGCYFAFKKHDFLIYVMEKLKAFGLAKIRLDFKKDWLYKKKYSYSRFKTLAEIFINIDNFYKDNKFNGTFLTGDDLTNSDKETTIVENNRFKSDHLLKSLTDHLNTQEEHDTLQNEDPEMLIKIEKKPYEHEKNSNILLPIKTERELYSYNEWSNILFSVTAENELRINEENKYASKVNSQTAFPLFLEKSIKKEKNSTSDLMSIEPDMPSIKDECYISNIRTSIKRENSNSKTNDVDTKKRRLSQ